MLRSLHIRNYILIDSLDVDFPEGLVIVTGQTGAGKSIILGALSLLSGTRADASQISDGADSCVVEGEFAYDPGEKAISSILEENDLDAGDATLIIRRVIARSGRSRCFVNDIPASVQCVASICSRLLDIHSQHKSLLLTEASFQLQLLDRYAGNGETLSLCSSAWTRLCSARRELSSLQAKLDSASSEGEYNAAQLEQLEAAALRDGELEELEQEQKILANAGQIRDNLAEACEMFSPSSDGPARGVDATLRDIRRALEKSEGFLPSLSGLSERLESARIELDDIASEAESALRGLNPDDSRLATVEERLQLLYSLMRKHSCHSVSELVGLRERLSSSFADTEEISGRIAALERDIASLQGEYDSLCARLHAAREAAVPAFSAEICKSLKYLELERATFGIGISPSAPGASGSDSVCYVFDANGSAPAALHKCASGGELSRIMLCLKEMMSRFSGMPTMIFDEIDTGVSGSVADRTGSMICRMAAGGQVMAITHLPQVAAKGNAHFVVRKEEGPDGRMRSRMDRLDGEGRILEIARLLSGSTITPEAVANAESLLNFD